MGEHRHLHPFPSNNFFDRPWLIVAEMFEAKYVATASEFSGSVPMCSFFAFYLHTTQTLLLISERFMSVELGVQLYCWSSVSLPPRKPWRLFICPFRSSPLHDNAVRCHFPPGDKGNDARRATRRNCAKLIGIACYEL